MPVTASVLVFRKTDIHPFMRISDRGTLPPVRRRGGLWVTDRDARDASGGSAHSADAKPSDLVGYGKRSCRCSVRRRRQPEIEIGEAYGRVQVVGEVVRQETG